MIDKLDFFESILREEFPENQERAITPEEIEKLTIREESLISKGIFILKRGNEIQKKAVMMNLYAYMREKGSNDEFFPLILNCIDQWYQDFLAETIPWFKRVFVEKLVNEKNSSKFLDICVNQLTFDTQPQWYQWLDLMIEVIPSCRMAIIQEIYQNYDINDMLSVKKAQKIRIRGTEILLNFVQGILRLRDNRLSEYNGSLNELEKQILQKILNQAIVLCQDNQWVLRKICAEKLEDIGVLFNIQEYEQILSKEMKELLEDEEIIVRIGALISLFRIIYNKSQAVITVIQMDLLMSQNLDCILSSSSQDEESQLKLTKEFGKICYCLKTYYNQTFQKFEKFLAQFYHRVINKSDDCSLQLNAAFNLPAMSQIFEDKSILDCSEITLQFSIFLEDVFSKQQSHSSTADTSPTSSFINLENFSSVQLGKKQSNNDEQQFELARQIVQGIHEQIRVYIASKSLNCRLLAQNILQGLLSLLTDNQVIEALKPSVALLLSTLIYNNCRKIERQNLIDSVIIDLALSKSVTQRKAFLTFCEQTLANHTMSKKSFLDHFYEPLMRMKNDKVMPIRRRFCQICELLLIKMISRDDKDQRLDIVNSLNKLKNDEDNEVSEQAFDSEQRALTDYKETDDEYFFKKQRETQFHEYEKELERRGFKEQLEEEQRRRSEEEHKYEIMKLLQDSKFMRRKTMRQVSKVSIPAQKKLVKRNSLNENIIHSISIQQKDGGLLSSSAKKALNVRRQMSGLPPYLVKEENTSSTSVSSAVVLATQTSNISYGSCGLPSIKQRGNSLIETQRHPKISFHRKRS